MENRGLWRNYAMIYTKNDSPREMSIKDFVFRSSRPILWIIKAKTFFYPNNRTSLFFPTPPTPILEKSKIGKKKMKNKVIGGIMPWYVQKMILRAKWVSKISFSDRLVQSRGLLRRKRFFTLTIGLPFLSYPPKRMILTGGILTDPSLPTDFLRPQSRPQPFWCVQSPLGSVAHNFKGDLYWQLVIPIGMPS